jgi:hypothetical protein
LGARNAEKIAYFFLCAILTSACAGRNAHPVEVIQETDQNKNCKELTLELQEIDEEIIRLYSEIYTREKYNKVAGLAGILIPFAGIIKDYKNAPLVEAQALRKRHNYLVKVERDKGCGFEHSMKPVLEHCKDFYTLSCIVN